MRKYGTGRLTLAALVALCILAQPALSAATTCRMTYSTKGWSAFYAAAHGSGTITCDNGQTAHVSIRAKGGGLTVGKSKITDGEGRFSEVQDISELFGTYAAAQAHAGMGDSATARVMTKGTVSLALSGKGKGIDLGITFGEFVIEKAGAGTQKNHK